MDSRVSATPTRVYENGTMIGALTDNSFVESRNNLCIPEIVISASYSSGSLQQNRCCESTNNMSSTSANTATSFETAVESTALLDGKDERHPVHDDDEDNSGMHHDEFEQFIMNRTTSESNMLESSIYSELQFPPSIGGISLNGGSSNGGVVYYGSGGPTTMNASPQTPAGRGRTSRTASPGAVDTLNSSACSRSDSRNQAKRNARRKHKSKSKCSTTPRVVAGAHAAAVTMAGTYPPQYTTIYLDGGGAANAMGQIASAAATSPFLQAPNANDAQYLQQQYQYYQQRPMLSAMNTIGHHHMGHHHRSVLNANFPQPDGIGAPQTPGAAAISAAMGGLVGPVTTPATVLSSPSPVSPTVRGNFRKWFSRPSLPFVIGILALGGVACTLGGIVLGSTGLIEHSTQYLSAALLMIGIGVSLLVISGAIWRLSLPDDTDECPCFRHMETCRNCNSPYCSNRIMPGSYMYPEFQHRPPPPSYLTSLNECGSMGILFHPGTAQAGYSAVRMNTPPPLYRSTNSLSVYAPATNSLGNAAPTNVSATLAVLPEQNAILESLQNPLTKEINYLELD